MEKLQDLELPEEVFDNVLIGLHLKCMKAFGYITSKQQQNKRFHLCKGVFFIASFALSCFLIFVKISKGVSTTTQGSISCATAFTYLSTGIAIINAYFQKKRVVRMVIFLHDDIKELLHLIDTEEEVILANTTKYLRFITGLVWITTLGAASTAMVDCLYRTFFKPETVFNMPQVLNGTAQPILLFQLYPFGEVYDNFIVGYMGPFYAALLGLAIIPCWHTFVTCLIKYIILKYAIVCKRLKEYDFAKVFPDFNDEKFKSESEKDVLYWHTRMCQYCVSEQTKLRWFTMELEALIRIPVFLDYIIFSVLMCFLFYGIAMGNPTNIDYMFFAMYIFIMLSLLWLYHWHATLVTEGNEELCYALYCSPWYTFPVKAQKQILLMMTESAKPLIMNAVFVEMHVKTFVDVVRGAYSYFSILKNANLEE